MPLGTLGSWMRDGLVAGALLPPAALLTMLIVLQALEGGKGDELVELVGLSLASGILGAALALLVVPGAWWLASRGWRLPPLALSLGPSLGAGCALVLLELIALMMDGHRSAFSVGGPALRLGFGALALGPPWMAYLAVRSRGRSGMPAVLGAIAWGACCAALSALAWTYRAWLGG